MASAGDTGKHPFRSMKVPARMIDDEETEALRRRLEAVMVEHRDMDDVIARLMDTAPYDMLQLQRLKKRKLALKDEIARLQAQITPDIIA